MPLYLPRKLLNQQTAAAAEAQTQPLLDDLTQQYRQAMEPPAPLAQPEQPAWSMPSLDSLGVSQAASSVMGAIGSFTAQRPQPEPEQQPTWSWALPSLDSLGVRAPKAQTAVEPEASSRTPGSAPASVDGGAATPPSAIPGPDLSPDSGTPVGPDYTKPAPSAPVAPSPSTGGPLRAHAESVAKKYGLDFGIFDRQLNQESGYRTDAVSSAGARGPGQFMPATGNAVARQLGVTPEQFWASPELQVEGAALHMRDLLAANKGDYRMALAAYNAGQGNVDKWGEGVFGGDFAGGQTRDYVNIILGPGAASGKWSPPNAAPSGAAAPSPPSAPAPAVTAPSPQAAGGDDQVNLYNPNTGQRAVAPRSRLDYFKGGGWVEEAKPQASMRTSDIGEAAVDAPVSMRGPLLPTPGDAFPTDPFDADSGPREATPGSVGAQPLPQTYGPPLSEAGPERPQIEVVGASTGEPIANPAQVAETSIPTPYVPVGAATNQPVRAPSYEAPVAPRQTPAAEPEQRYLDLSMPSPPGWQAMVDGAGQVVEWVRERLPQAADVSPEEDAQRRREVAGVASGESLTPGYSPTPVRTNTRPPVESTIGEPDYVPQNPSVFGEGGLLEPAGGAVRQQDRMLEIAALASAQTGMDANPNEQITRRAVHDPAWRAQNPQLAAEYDDLERQFGLNVIGQVGDAAKFGSGPARRTVEVIQDQIETARAAFQRARASGDTVAERAASDQWIRLEGDLVDAQNARAALEPQIRSDVGARANPLTLTEESADDLSTAMRPRETGQMRPEDLSGPVSVPTDMSGRANATAGVVPDAPAPDRLATVNRALSQGLASTFSGGVSAAAADATDPGSPQGENESDAEYAARRARERAQRMAVAGGVGALLPAAAARGTRAALRAAGRGSDEVGGALAMAGNVPGRPDPLNPRRLRGNPITSTPTEEVSRLRLDKFPEEVRDLIQQSAKDQDWARTQRRGVLPDEVVQNMAADDARSVDQIIKSGKAGKAYNAEETVAIRNATASQADVVRSLSDEIAEARANGMTPDLLIARRAAEATKLDGMVKLAEGARAEAGRTLRQYRQQAKLIEMDPNAAIQQIYKRLGGKDNAEAAVDEYTKMVQDGANPIQLAKFWSKVEAGEIKGSDLFALYRRFNMLSGPRTVEVNALSGGVNLGYEVLAGAAETAVKGRPSEAVAEVAAPFKAAGRAFQNAVETAYHGVSAEQAARGDIPRNLSSRTDNSAAKAALTVMEIPDRLNAAVDQFFRTMTEDWAATRLAQQQARQIGLTSSSKGWTEAVAQNLESIRNDPSKFPEVKAMADRVTFSEEPGGIVKWFEEGKRKHPNTVGFVLPFIRTPANIASRAVDLSPLGLARTAVEAGLDVGRGRANIAPRVRDNVLGTAAAVWAYNEAQQGNITGAGPDDPEKLAALRATGWQPYSIKIGDQYWSYANFAPFSLALSMGAAAHEAQKYAKDGKGDALSVIADGAERTGKVVTDMTVLAGLGAVVKSIQDPDRYGTQWLSQALQQLMPAGSLVNTVGQATDDKIRRSERTDVGTQISQNLQARVPGLRENVPAAKDPLGRDIPNEQTGLGALNPFRPTTERPDPTIQAFLDAGVDIGKPKENLTIRAGAAPITLTPAEQRRWNELRGAQLMQNAPKVAEAQNYQSADKGGRERALTRILTLASDGADRQLMAEIGSDELRRRMTESAQKKKAS